MNVLKQIDFSKLSFYWDAHSINNANRNLLSLKFKAIYIPWDFLVENMIIQNAFTHIRAEKVFIKKSQLDKALLSKIKQTGFDMSKIDTY